jgi:predicted transposase YbfD/YdcC
MHQVQTTGVSIFEHFGNLTDPRIDRNQDHKLLDIVGLSICGVICGADGWTEIEEFGKSKEPWLRSFLELPNGIPSHDTIGRVFARLLPGEFQHSFQRWIQAIGERTEGQIISIDGKTLRRSYDRSREKAAIHMVSAWASENHLLLGQVKTREKSNEITAIPSLLEVLAINGCIVTLDAMGCQTDIARQIVEQGADYVLALKGNHGTVHEKVVTFFDHLHEGDQAPQPVVPDKGDQAPQPVVQDEQISTFETVDGDHGRIEIRRYCQVSDLRWLEERSQWKGLQSVGMVEAERHIGETVSVERRYYLSSLALNAPQFAEAVRGHWSIENTVHWSLDVSFREDDCRIRTGYAPENFAVLRHIALNLLKQDTRCKRGMKTKRLKAGWDHDYLAHVLFSGG